jgi:predicted Zn finger-like uncharacterized protein
MQTQCPHCSTLFRVTEAALNAAQGKVRCCLCRQVFDANAHQVTAPAEEHVPLTETSPGRSLQPLLSDLASELEQLAANADRPRWQKQLSWATLGLLALTLCFQYIYFHRERLAQNGSVRPLVSAVCAVTNCRIPMRKDVGQIALLDRQVRTHPDYKQAILVQATLENRADFPQPYPVVQFSMSDIRGQVIASRRFGPREYLPPDVPTGIPVFKPNTTAVISLELLDPGEEAVSFEFDFL